MSKFKNLLLAFADNSAPTRLAISQFCENVARRTNGLISVSAVPDKQLGQPMKLITLVMEGKIDMLVQPVDRWGGIVRKFGCVPTPFAFDDHAHVDRVFLNEFDNWIAPDLACCGLTHLASWEWGFRQVTNAQHPILEPADFRALKIRVPPSSIYRATIFAFGGVPVVVEFDKLSKVIKQRLIDGQENPFIVFSSLGLQSEHKYISLLNYSYGTLGHLINKCCFEGLSPEQQAIICEESKKSGRFLADFLRVQEEQQLVEFASRGGQIDRPRPAPFKERLAPVYEEARASFGTDNVRSFLAMLQRQRKAVEKPLV